MNVEVLNLWAERVVSLFWPILWQSSLLIMLLLVLEFALRRYVRAAVRYAVWLVVLVKLVLPPSLALPSGAAWWLRPAAAAPPPRANHVLVVTYQDEHAPSLPAQTIRTIPIPPSPKISPAAAGLVLWAVVSVAFMALILAKWIRVARELRRATAGPDWLRRLLEDAAHCAGLRRVPRLRLTEQPVSPALCGLVRPTVLVPRALVEQLPTNQLRSILVHELMHLSRADLWVNCAQALFQAVYWWHPLLWLANARIRCVREEAVDDAVMQTLKEQAGDYAPTLLRVARLTLRRPLATLGLVGILESPTLLRRRIERLLTHKAPRRAELTFVGFLGALGFAAVAVPMGPSPALDSSATRSNEPPQLYTRLLKVDTNTFIQGLKSVVGFSEGGGVGMLPESSSFRKSELPENASVQEQVREFFKSIEVDLAPPKTLYYNDREGALLVRATRQEIETIEQTLQVLNLVPQNRGEEPARTSEADVSPAATSTQTPATAPGRASHASTLVQDGKLLYEMGKLDDAEKRLKQALDEDSANHPALYYLSLIEEARVTQTLNASEPFPKQPLKVSPGRQAIFSALDKIKFESVTFEQVPLVDVVRYLNEEARRRDPKGKGVNFIINPGQSTTEASGQPVPVDISSLPITVNPPLRDIRLADVLDAIVKVAGTPLKYSIEDYAVVFSRKLNQPPALYTRVFKVDPNAFIQGLERVTGKIIPKAEPERSQALFLLIREFFTSIGAELVPPKTLYYKDREGSLLVRATLADLDTIEAAVQVLNIEPLQVNLKTRFYAVPQDFALSVWDVVSGTKLASSKTSNSTQILTHAQAQVLLKVLDSAAGVELLGEGAVTTLSGRQTQIQAVDFKTVATNINPRALSPPGISTNADALYLSTQVPLGPSLDVIPYVSADRWTIQVTVTPSLTEFQGYDTPTNHVQAYIEGKETSLPLPLPHFRVTQVTTSAIVWDGQTLLVGTPPESGGSEPKGKQLLITLTPTVIDPAGNRIRFHHEDSEYRILDPNLANRTNH